MGFFRITNFNFDMKKQLLLSVMLVLGSVNAFSATVKFASPLKAGKEYAETVYYSLNTETKEATVISGTWEYTKTVVIPAEVEYYDYNDDSNPLNGEVFSVTTIAKHAFYYCYDLEEVILGENLTTIKEQAFYRCGTTSKPILINFDSEALTTIEKDGICQTVICPNDGVTLRFGKNIAQLGPESLTSTDNWYSWGTRYNIEKFAVEEGNTHFCADEKGVLYDKEKTTLIAFPQYSSITSYEVPSSVTTIRSYAFYSMKKLKTVTGGDNVVRLGVVISGLSSLHMGAKLTSMSNTAFMYCSSDFVPDIDAANPVFELKEKVLFKYSTAGDTILIWYLKSNKTADYVMPANVTEIGNYAFYNHQYIKTIDFKNNTKITSKKIGTEAFLSTKYDVEFLNATNVYANIDGVWYTSDLKKMVVYGENVGIVDYVMPDQTTTIPRAAIKNNGNIKTFAINKALSSFDRENMYKFTSLERYSVDEQNKDFSADTCGVLYNKKQTKILSYPCGNTRAYYKLAKGTTNFASYVFYNNTYLKVLDLGTDIKSVVDGNNNSMAGMKSLQAIKVATMVPPTVTTSTFTTDQLTSGKIRLYVPLEEGAKEIYENASIWNRFYIICDTSKFESDIRNFDVDYYVNHFQQNVENNEYMLAETTKMTGKLLSTTAVVAKTTGDFAGFDAQDFSQITLNRSGMSVNIYYHRKHYTVTWMNGNEQLFSDSYRFGASFLDDKPDDPTPAAGKHFVGWNTDKEATVALTFNGSERVLANTIYYAIFADNASKKYHVEHYQENANDDGYTKVDTDEDSKPFGSLTNAVAKSYEGFTAQSFSQQTIAEDESTVVRIDYKRDSSIVTWNNGVVTVLTGKYKYGSTLQVPADPAAPEATQHFVGWNTDSQASSALNLANATVPVADVTYYAIFADNASKQYTIEHYLQNEDGETYGEPVETETGAGLVGSTTAATAHTYAGFTTPETVNNQKITESNEITIKIYYTRNRYDVIWKKGTVELSRNEDVLYGTSITAPADPAAEAGYHFVGWNTDGQAEIALNMASQTVPAGDITYYAIFGINATVHYTVHHYQENLDGSYPTEPTNIDEGTGVFGLKTSATARTYEGFTPQTITQQTILEDESTVVRINYERNTHTLTWNKNEGDFSGEYTSGNGIKYGAPITAPKASRTGYDLYGWGTSEDATETVTPATTMPDSNLTYYALWNIKQYHAAFYFNNGTDEEFSGYDFDYNAIITPPSGHPQTSDYENHDWLGWSKKPDGNVITDDSEYGRMPIGGVNFYAIWKIHSNNLTWDVNGGNALTGNYTKGLVDYDTPIVKPADPTRTGYTFMGWATSADGTPGDVAETMPDEELHYYAIWKINSHTIEWNANGGELATQGTNGKVDYNTQITPATTADREGYTFKGWNTSADATTTIEPATKMPDADLTYYAVWQVHQHNLKWYPNGGSFTGSDPSGSVAYGTDIIVPQVNRTDWKCAGWGASANATPDEAITPASKMPDNDLTYYAIWILKTNYVTWKRNYSPDDDFNFTSTSVEVGDEIFAPANSPEREHYHFLGWSETRNGQVLTNFGIMDTKKKDMYAIWQINSNLLTWDANGGQFDAAVPSDMVEFGAELIEPAVSRTGYTLVGWNTDANATDAIEITTMPDEPTTYFAIWQPNTYDIVWKYNNGTNETFTTTQVVFDEDIVAPSSNPTRDYYQFAGWATTSTGEVVTNFGKLTTEGATIYAQWQLRKFELTWNANGGQLSGNYTQGEVEYGTEIVAPTATRTNYIFAGWGTPANPDSVVNITTMPDSSLTCIAIWVPDHYVVEWRLNDGTDQNYTSTSVDFGNKIIEPEADPQREHYQFMGWSATESGTVITDFGTMTTTRAIFYAQWRINTHTLAWNANGGKLSGNYTSGLVEYGAPISAPTATRTGYEFIGWGSYAEAPHSVDVSTMPDEETEYFALWAVNSYAIWWKQADGQVFATDSVAFGDPIKAPVATPEREHYTFAGWSDRADGQIVSDFGTMPHYDTTFYAVWNLDKYQITWFDADGSIFETATLAYGETIKAPAKTPEREKFTFTGWSASVDGDPITNFGIATADTAFYAVWQEVVEIPEIKWYTIEWRMELNSDSVFATTRVAEDSAIVAPAGVPSRENYTFLGWSLIAGATEAATDYGVATIDTAFYAVWQKVEENPEIKWYTIEWRMELNSDSVFATTRVAADSAIVAPAGVPSRENYTFLGWSLIAGATEAATDYGTATIDTAFYAVWQKVEENPEIKWYTIEWRMELNSDSVFATTKVAEDSAIVAPAAVPSRENYTFLGWSLIAGATEAAIDYGTATIDTAFYAVWQKVEENPEIKWYTIEWRMELDSDSVFATTKVAEDSVIVAPVGVPSRENYTFLGWSLIAGATEAATDYGTATIDTAFYAVWVMDTIGQEEPVEYEIVWYITDTVFITTRVAADSTIYAPIIVLDTLSDIEKRFRFSGWASTPDGNVIENFGTAKSDTAFYAVWEEILLPELKYEAVWYLNNGTNEIFATTEFAAEQVITSPLDKPLRNGYNFAGWATSQKGAVTTDFGTMTSAGAKFYAIWKANASFTVPDEVSTCESGNVITLSGVSGDMVFEWSLNGKIDNTQTGPQYIIPDDAELVGTVSVKGTSGTSTMTKTISYQLNTEIMAMLWDDVVTVVNPEGRFNSFKWYHNGEFVSDQEFYCEEGGLTGSYYLEVTTTDGLKMNSCKSEFSTPNEVAVSVYPNPAVERISVKGSLLKAGQTIFITDENGTPWIKTTATGSVEQNIDVTKLLQGLYILNVEGKSVSFIKL